MLSIACEVIHQSVETLASGHGEELGEGWGGGGESGDLPAFSDVFASGFHNI